MSNPAMTLRKEDSVGVVNYLHGFDAGAATSLCGMFALEGDTLPFEGETRDGDYLCAMCVSAMDARMKERGE